MTLKTIKNMTTASIISAWNQNKLSVTAFDHMTDSQIVTHFLEISESVIELRGFLG